MKAVFSFADLNLYTILQEKRSDKCMFYAWYFENKGH